MPIDIVESIEITGITVPDPVRGEVYIGKSMREFLESITTGMEDVNCD